MIFPCELGLAIHVCFLPRFVEYSIKTELRSELDRSDDTEKIHRRTELFLDSVRRGVAASAFFRMG